MTEPGDSAEHFVRLALNELLHQLQIADAFAANADGESALQAFAAECELHIRAASTRVAALSEEQHAKWAEATTAVCKQFFAQAEQQRRLAIASDRYRLR